MAQVEYRAAVTAGVDFEERTIDLIATPYDEEIEVMHQGHLIRERVDPGSFKDIDPSVAKISVNRDHNYERTVGRIVELRDEPIGALAVARISATPLGDETLRLAADGVLGASVAMLVSKAGMEMRNGLRRIFRVRGLDHIALLPNQAYSKAQVLAVRRSDELEDVPTPNLDGLLAIAGMADIIRGNSTRH